MRHSPVGTFLPGLHQCRGRRRHGKSPRLLHRDSSSHHGDPWSTAAWTQDAGAADYGNVDPRYNRKAVAVFLDGSIRLLDIEALRDMRLWSRNAADQDNANYNIPHTGGGRL
jgi:hypothetical protein